MSPATPAPTATDYPLPSTDYSSREATSGAARRPLNALKHGLTSVHFVHSPEESEAFQTHLDALHNTYAPIGHSETTIVRRIADNEWRLNRIPSIEAGFLALTAEANPDDDPGLIPARAWLTHERSFCKLSLYEGRIRRAIERDKAELAQLQASRPPAQPQVQPQPKAAAPAIRPFNPEEPFPLNPPLPREFIFSDALIIKESNRQAIAEAAARKQKPAVLPGKKAA